ncbi:hypothetical protein GUJ93_ZPchr0163g22909 [Zizania palustris]|uniref:Uncharacterized protein n=1 Tax=Zizania palustris TaxID=103762 RepID=A0A8J6C2T8_ZIZPA|nr:hypothetical protein GUJ93_ZPchr0163g22909 [Zizania palustris]
MTAATAVDDTISCGEAAAHAPNSGAVPRCVGQRRPTAVSRRAGVCGGPTRVLTPPSSVARRQVSLAAITVGGGSVKLSPPFSLAARWRLRALQPSALSVRRLVWILPPSSLAAQRQIRCDE